MALLQKNARISNKELAAAIGLAPSTCSERVKRLEEHKYFKGFHAELYPRNVGVGLQALVFLRLNDHSLSTMEQFRYYILSVPEVVEMTHLSGVNDYMLKVAVRDNEHLRALLLRAFSAREEVGHIETSVIFETVAKHDTPIYIRDKYAEDR
jgi:DNA-binding Lrp family transcriptional regulator